MTIELNNLVNLFGQLQNSCIIDYAFSRNMLRLLVKTPVAANISTGFETIQIVLENCVHLKYLSYTQTQESRAIVNIPEAIFNQKLLIQGIEKRPNNQYIVYCNTCQNLIEAGELHFTATGFKLYDQEFGQLTCQDFCDAAK